MASFAFKVEDIEPKDDPIWRLAAPAVRQAFWRAVVGFTLEAKDSELASGLDRFGAPLTPIAASTRKRGRWRSYTGLGSAGNPPLVPAQVLSRTRALLTGRALANSAEFYWTFDVVSGLPWGQVLGWHRAGSRHLPVRDVIGLAPQSLAQVQTRADLWWKVYKLLHPRYEHEMVLETVQAPKPIPPHRAPRPIPLTGRIDLEHVTFGVGATREMIERSIKAGTTTGFRQLPPRSRAALKPERTPSGPPKLTRVKAGADAASKAAARAAAEAKAIAEAKAKAKAKAIAKAAEEATAIAEAAAARAAAEAKAIAEAEAKRTLTREAIQSAIHGLGYREQNVVVSTLIQERQSAHATSVQYHGMANPELMHSIEIEGIRFHFPPLYEGTGIASTGEADPILRQLRSLANFPPIPPGIARHTKDVYMTTQSNKDDGFWEIAYQTPGFQAGATAGNDEQIVIYRSTIGMGSFAHEMGHNLAKGSYGDVHPPQGSAYRDAIQSGEPPVSEYARNSPAEDFAEAVRLYYLERAGLATVAPKRYAALEELIHGPAT